MAPKKYSRGMPTHQARRAMLFLIAVLTFILAVTIVNPSLIQSFDDLLPLIRNNPFLYYILNFSCILLALYVGFFRRNKEV
jgi:uncharacterized BrkB/YihY/UPF0761 family membrane protein